MTYRSEWSGSAAIIRSHPFSSATSYPIHVVEVVRVRLSRAPGAIPVPARPGPWTGTRTLAAVTQIPRVVLTAMLAAVLALVGGALAAWQVWEAVSPLPTAAQLTDLGRLVSPDDPARFSRADPVRDDIADTGTLVPLRSYDTNAPGAEAPDPNRSLDPIRDRLDAAGWTIVEETTETRGSASETYSAETYLVATHDHLRVFVVDEYWSSLGDGGGGLSVKVLRDTTGPVVAAGWAGAALGALLGAGLVTLAARHLRDRPGQRRLAGLLTMVAAALLVPSVLWTLYRLLPDGVTTAHNYVQEPFWRGLTGDHSAVPSAVVAAVALLVAFAPRLRRTPWTVAAT